ncbi:MAG: type III polyketide synthase [Phycisphaeraceae bacterium]
MTIIHDSGRRAVDPTRAHAKEKTPKDRSARVLGLGTALPAHRLSREMALRFALDRLPDRQADLGWIARRYDRSGVDARFTCLPPEAAVASEFDLPSIEGFFQKASSHADKGPSTAERMALYERCAPPLIERAVSSAIASAGLDAHEITHLITTTCTGFFSPGLDHLLIDRLGLHESVQRVQVGFMGCHAAINGLGVAEALASREVGARVLLACVELCSLHFQYDACREQVVANALFGDGAAAAVVGQPGEQQVGTGSDHVSIRVLGRWSHVLPGTHEAMSWRVTDHGFRMTLKPEVPGLLQGCLHEGLLDRWLAVHGLNRKEVSGWAVHPGGPRVLDAVEDALSLPSEALSVSREILLSHGNMSSPTILFILRALMASGVRGHTVLMAFGPGLTLELALVHIEV